MKVKFKKLDEKARLPEYATRGDSGMDLFFLGHENQYNGEVETAKIYPGDRYLAKTGLAIELEDGFEAQVRAKSGRALKEGLAVLNGPGTVDAGYRGALNVILYNADPVTVIELAPGQKIAQLVVVPVQQAEIVEVKELSDSERGTGGFGSTGL